MFILPIMPPQNGYEPRSPILNEDEGILDISDEGECTLHEESKIVADTLILRCSLRPIPLIDKTIKVQLTSEGETLESALLYYEGSIAYGYNREVKSSYWKAIALDYVGIGRGIYHGESFIIQGNTLPSGKLNFTNPLYVKPFLIETQNIQERHTTLNSGQVLFSPPGILDTPVSRGYGGYYKEGIPVEEMQQVFYTLTSTQTQTQVRLDFTAFSTPQEETLSLPGALATGYAKLKVITEVGELIFSSFLCERVFGHPTWVNVYFKP